MTLECIAYYEIPTYIDTMLHVVTLHNMESSTPVQTPSFRLTLLIAVTRIDNSISPINISLLTNVVMMLE